MKLLIKLLVAAFACLSFTSCGLMEGDRSYRRLSFSLPNSWDEVESGRGNVYTATNPPGDGTDRLVIVAVPHRGNPGSMSEARFRAMADRVANKIVEHYKSSTGNFTLLEKRFEMRDGLPHLFIRSSFRATVNGEPGKEMILSVCIIASSPEVYSFALRETKQRYDSDPGRFEKMVGKIKIRK